MDECAAVYDDDKVIVAVVSDSEGEDDNSPYYDGACEGKTEIKLPSEVWGMVLDCKLCSVVLISIVLLSFFHLTRNTHIIILYQKISHTNPSYHLL